GRDRDVCGTRFVDHESQVLDRIRVPLVGIRKNLDDASTEVDVLANCPAHLIPAVGECVLGKIEHPPVGWRVPELAAEGTDDSPCKHDRWSRSDAEPDRILEIPVGILTRIAYIAYGGEACLEHLASVVRSEQGAIASGPLKGMNPEIAEVPLRVDVRAKMRVRVGEPRQYGGA